MSGYIQAIIGAVVWAGYGIFLRPEGSYGLILTLLLLAMLVYVPIALQLISDGKDPLHLVKVSRWFFPIAALCVVFSASFPAGMPAGLLSIPWLLLCVLLAVVGVARLGVTLYWHARSLAEVLAFIYLPVGGVWFVASRFGFVFLGFTEPIVTLTAVHFHYTAFLTGIYLSLWSDSEKAFDFKSDIFYRYSLAAVLLGTPLLALGITISPILEIIAVAVLVSGLGVHAVQNLVSLRRPLPWLEKGLRLFGSLCLIAAISYAMGYALGRFRGQSDLDIAEMARTHGLLQALGFVPAALFSMAHFYRRQQRQYFPGVVLRWQHHREGLQPYVEDYSGRLAHLLKSRVKEFKFTHEFSGAKEGSFHRLHEMIRRYRFFPESRVEGTPIAEGNIIKQGGMIFQALRYGLFEMHTAVRVTSVEENPDGPEPYYAFSVEALEGHLEYGTESFRLEQKADGRLFFHIHGLSTTAPKVFRLFSKNIAEIRRETFAEMVKKMEKSLS